MTTTNGTINRTLWLNIRLTEAGRKPMMQALIYENDILKYGHFMIQCLLFKVD